jgi:hypothetical protein
MNAHSESGSILDRANKVDKNHYYCGTHLLVRGKGFRANRRVSNTESRYRDKCREGNENECEGQELV